LNPNTASAGAEAPAAVINQVHDIFVAACRINLSVLGQLVREPVRGDGRRLRHNDGEQDAFHGEIEK